MEMQEKKGQGEVDSGSDEQKKKAVKEIKGVLLEKDGDEGGISGASRGKKENLHEKEETRGELKGLPHQQVPQPLKDFSSEALEHI